jgi:hypothetical protein
MPSQSFFLCALIPPGSVEAEVGKVQADLFSEHGLASAEAVPPLVPISFLDPRRLQADLLSRLNAAVASGWSARLKDAGWVEGHLYARIDSAGAWSALRTCALDQGGIQAGGLFPAAEGFYLGCADAPPEARSGIKPLLAPRSFRSGTLVLMVLEAGAQGAQWWSELHWEITEERILRGSKQR